MSTLATPSPAAASAPRLAQRYRLRLQPGAQVELISRGTLHPRYGLPMTIHKR